MQYANYSFENIVWVGPNITVHTPSIKKEIIEDGYILRFYDNIPTNLVFVQKQKVPQYAIITSYMVYDKTLLLPLMDNYETCFKRIMSVLECELIKNNEPETVRKCLTSHSIIPAIEA
jgi:hypothetical protein